MITVRLKGGMGNQMFEYAAGRALAIRNNTELVLDLTYLSDRTPRPKRWHFTFREYDLDVFSLSATLEKKDALPLSFLGTAGIIFQGIWHKIYKPRGRERSFQFDPAFRTFPDGTYLDGFWQSPKYFEGYEEIIRNDFTLKNALSEHIEKKANEIANTESVCVHLRRGDFLKVALHTVCDAAYYERGIAEIASSASIQKIYVFSDDIAWCRENVSFGYPTEFVGDEYAGEKNTGHLHLMRQCKYFVIANSSFSWWAAWLSSREGKKVIAPKRWFSDPSIDTSDIMPSSWLRI